MSPARSDYCATPAMTLPDLLAGLTICALLAIAAHPTVARPPRSQLQHAAFALENTLIQARSLAQSRGEELIVCAANPDGSDRCDPGHRWHGGWLVIAAERGLALQRSPALPPGVALLGAERGASPAVALRFNRYGTLRAGGPYGTSAAFLLCPANDISGCRDGRRVTVAHGGQIAVAPPR